MVFILEKLKKYFSLEKMENLQIFGNKNKKIQVLLETDKISRSINSTSSGAPFSNAMFMACDIFERFFIISFSKRLQLFTISSILLSFSAISVFFSNTIRSFMPFCF